MQSVLNTPLGIFTIECTADALTAVCFGLRPGADTAGDDTPLLREAKAQLKEYFAGKRKTFTLPLAPAGTPFQRSVWTALQAIPYGQTCSYQALAKAAGRPNACRAAGSANGKNPLPILIPCHRVIRSDGSIGGYAGGIELKRSLLELEKRYA